MCTSEGVQGGGRSKPGLILLDFWQTGPVDPDFFGQEPSLDCKDSFEPKSSFLDQMVQKLRDHKGLYVFPFPGLIYRYLGGKDVNNNPCKCLLIINSQFLMTTRFKALI